MSSDCGTLTSSEAIIPPSGSAVLADAVEDDLVIGDAESLGGEFLEAIHAFWKIEDTPARLALKMMVMPLVGAFIARRLSGNLHAADESVFRECLKRAINGGDTDRGDCLESESLNLFRQEGAVLIHEGCLDRFFLAGCASFRAHVGRVITIQ